MSTPRSSGLEHVSVRLRVSVDRAKWIGAYGVPPDADIAAAVRRYVVQAIHESEAARSKAIAGVRRDQL